MFKWMGIVFLLQRTTLILYGLSSLWVEMDPFVISSLQPAVHAIFVSIMSIIALGCSILLFIH